MKRRGFLGLLTAVTGTAALAAPKEASGWLSIAPTDLENGVTVTYPVEPVEQTITISTHRYAAFLLEDVVAVMARTDLKAKYEQAAGYRLDWENRHEKFSVKHLATGLLVPIIEDEPLVVTVETKQPKVAIREIKSGSYAPFMVEMPERAAKALRA